MANSLEPPKYAVLKWADWEQVQKLLEDGGHEGAMSDAVLSDAEVIRKQDITAAPVFFLYSNIIHAFMELNGFGTSHEGLAAIAEHFHQAGMDADAWPNKKLPD